MSIVLEDKSTIEAGYDISTIAVDPIAIAYRDNLEQEQKDIQTVIENEVLEGEELDVAWNLTLAANIISANVEYGQIEAIKNVDGVKDVFVETQYLPAVVGVNETDPKMATSSAMVGSTTAYNLGYTGAGSLVAVIDTGVDSDHQSFNDEAFEYSIDQLDKDVDLLTEEEVADVAKELNIYKMGIITDADISDLYYSSKIPFAYNYVDHNFDITHDNDTQGEHGSHVTGIAAANAYIPNGNGGFDKALTTVHTQGVAPDAQVLTMKVFGSKGGAYDSDYMVAIEDAIILGADSINLSLGSAVPGAGFSVAYQDIMDSLVNNDSGAVVTMAAGNAGYWAEETANAYPYYDDVNFDTVGTPASISTSMAVASVDNIGSTGNYVTVNGHDVYYTESLYTNDPLTTLAGSYDYVYIDSPGVLNNSNDFETLSSLVEGNVVLCNRGTSTFAEKATAAAEAGAKALIVVNNEDGVISMVLDGYEGTMPAVSITMKEGSYFKEGESAKEGTLTYYTGTIEIKEEIASSSAVADPENHYTMSSFSSWGVPSSLEMKPEITAPGGNIYSVNGGHINEETGKVEGGSDQYENMSGTSMAAPQVAGLTALITEYVEEEGLAEKYNINKRALIQSLLMSTAKPVIETYEEGSTNTAGESEGYYSVLSQGAGLANAADAINSQAFILMSEDSVLNPQSAADGKVKVELGDDPARSGEYSYSFTVTNISGSDVTYDLTTAMFTQDVSPDDDILDTWTVPVEANVTYDCGESVTVPAGESVDVTVSIEITDEYVTDELFYPNGAYIEGYTFLTPENSDDGAKGVQLSIPVFGFYGSWTDPAMYDNDSDFSEISYEAVEGTPYFFADSSSEQGYSYSYSGLYYEDLEDEEEYFYIPNIYGWYLEEDYDTALSRAAINGEALMTKYDVVQLRNGYAGFIVDVNGSKYYTTPAKYSYGAFYNDDSATTAYPFNTFRLGVTAAEAGANEGDTVQTSVVLVPEYYDDLIGDDGSFDAATLVKELGDGAFVSSPKMIVDNTKPEMIKSELNADGSLTVTVSDNQYVGYVGVLSRSGANLYDEGIPVQTSAGSSSEITFSADSIADAGQYVLIMVADYAGNVQSFEVQLRDDSEVSYTGMYAYSEEVYSSRTTGEAYNAWFTVDPDTVSAYTGEGIDIVDIDDSHSVVAAAYADGYIFHATADKELFVAPISDPGYDMAKVGNLSFTPVDMAFNATDGKLYAIDDTNYIWSINPLNGACKAEYMLPGFTELGDADADVNMDGKTNSKDAQAVLDYMTGKLAESEVDTTAGDLDQDETLSTYDAYLILLGVLGNFNVRVPYTMQGLTIDKNGTFYASGYMSDYVPESPQGYLSDFIPNQNIFVWDKDNIETIEAVLDGEMTEIALVLQSEEDGIDIGFDHGDNLIDAAGVLAYDSDNDLIYMAGDASAWFTSIYEQVYDLLAAEFDYLYVIDPVAKTWDYTNYDGDGNENSLIYAKYNSLLIVPESDFGKLEDPGDEITDIALSPESVTLMVGGSVNVEAILSPWNVSSEDVTIEWTSSEKSVATVNNGKVTAVGEGTAEITATVKGSDVSATMTVTVIPMPAITLRGNVWSDESIAGWSEFTTPNLSMDDITRFTERTNYIRAATDSTGQYLFGHDGVSIYKIDAETYEEIPLFDMNPDYLFPDAAPNLYFAAYNVGEDMIVAPATGGDTLLLMMPESGNLYTVDGLASDFGSPMAAIAYAGSSSSTMADYYYIICEDGTLAMLYITAGGSIGLDVVGKTGIKLKGVSTSTADGSGDNFASLIYDFDNSTADSEQLVLSYYTSGMDSAAISIINVDADGNVNVPGTAYFDDGVWPVSGLHFGAYSEQSASEALVARFDGSEYTAEINKDEVSSFVDEGSDGTGKAVVGKNLSVSASEDSGENELYGTASIMSSTMNEIMPIDNEIGGGTPTIDEDTARKEAESTIKILPENVSVDTENNEVTITVTACKGATNALYDIAYMDVLKIQEVHSLTTYSSYNTSDPKKVHLDFAFINPLSDDKEVATLVFTYDEEDEAGLDTEISLEPIEVKNIISPTGAPLAQIATPVKIYSVTVNVENGTYNAPETVGEGEALSISIIPSSGYTYPESVTVTVGGTVLTKGYTYNSGKGEVVILEGVITGNVVVDAACPKLPVSIPSTGTTTPAEGSVDVDVEISGNGSSNAPETAVEGEDLVFTLTPDEGYTLPDEIVVTVDGVVLDPSEYTYDPETGKVTIPGDKVTGKVEVKADFVAVDDSGSTTPDDGNIVLEAEADGCTVKVEAAKTALPDGVQLIVEPQEVSDGNSAVIEITLVDADGNPVQPNGNVTVTIDVPEALLGADTYHVYYKAPDGTLTDMNASYSDGKLTFVTDHFGTYVISVEKLTDDVSSDTTNPAQGDNSDDLPPATGVVALSVVPAIISAGVVMLSKKRRS